MGNTCTRDVDVENGQEQNTYIPRIVETEPPDEDDDQLWKPKVKHKEGLKSYLDEFQERNFERLLETFRTDKDLFVINQLLLCVQFFPNFDRSLFYARDVKREKEEEMNEKLGKVSTEGLIPGDRHVTLMHGMGEILSRYFIYRPPTNLVSKDTLYESYALRRPNLATFTCEGILPLEFYVNFDNYEVYPKTHFEDLEDHEYSGFPIFRMWMKEPNREYNKIPPGYVYLMLPDRVSKERSSKVAPRDSSGVYSIAGEATTDPVSSYCSSSVFSEEEETSSTKYMESGQRFLHHLQKKISQKQQQQLDKTQSVLVDSGILRKDTNLTPPPSPTKRPSKKDSHVFEPLHPVPAVKRPNTLLPAMFEEGENLDVVPQTSPTKAPRQRPTRDTNPFAFSSKQNKPMTSARKPLPVPSPDDDVFRSASQLNSPDHFRFQGSLLDTINSIGTQSEPGRQSQNILDLFMFPQQPKLLTGYLKAEISPEGLIVEEEELESDDNESSSSEDSDDSGNKSSESVEEHPVIVHTHLNSAHFSSVAVNDFRHLAHKLGLTSNDLQHTQVLNSLTIRCPVSTKCPTPEGKDFKILHTFTPSLFSRHWPSTTHLGFRQPAFRPKDFLSTPKKGHQLDDSQDSTTEQLLWPSRNQKDSIQDLGCNLVPQGAHRKRPSRHQQKEWRLMFPQGESNLLNAFKHVHWRAYIFTAILFRAFVSQLGPSGVSLEHVRHIIYYMCEQDYIFWNEEEAGTQVSRILQVLCESLGNHRLPNFFIPDLNMLRDTGTDNTGRVHSCLKQVTDNLIVYFIHALRNLTLLQKKKDFYPAPDLRKLYRLLTVSREEEFQLILRINNPGLRAGSMQMQGFSHHREGSSSSSLYGYYGGSAKVTKKKRKKDKRLKRAQSEPKGSEDFGMDTETAFSKLLEDPRLQPDDDRYQQKRRKKYEKFQRKKQKREDEEARRKALGASSEPVKERRKSIDLGTFPATKFSNLRMVEILRFFIGHFLAMAKKAIEFSSYSEATMYVLHVENICKLLKEHVPLTKTNMDTTTIDFKYLKECSDLRKRLGSKMAEYVHSKLSHLSHPDGSSAMFLSPLKLNGTSRKEESPGSNFILGVRKLPTPPPAPSPAQSSIRKFESADITLPVLPQDEYFPIPMVNFEPAIHEEFQLPEDDSLALPRRQSDAVGLPRAAESRLGAFLTADPGHLDVSTASSMRRHTMAEIGDTEMIRNAALLF